MILLIDGIDIYVIIFSNINIRFQYINSHYLIEIVNCLIQNIRSQDSHFYNMGLSAQLRLHLCTETAATTLYTTVHYKGLHIWELHVEVWKALEANCVHCSLVRAKGSQVHPRVSYLQCITNINSVVMRQGKHIIKMPYYLVLSRYDLHHRIVYFQAELAVSFDFAPGALLSAYPPSVAPSPNT